VIRTLIATAAVAALAGGEDRTRLRPLPDAGKNMQTGPAVGQRIPDFSLPDQHGATRSLKDLRGPKGLMLAFVRSADW
jgi:cytochrome oxidase Cu insertion factor (SCO1/SenC/PrrC family)